MQKKKKVSDESVIKEKIEYLRLNFKKVPKTLIATDNLNFKALKGYDEKQYKQYKFIKISDIDILLTPTHRLDSLNERYDNASPLYMYLDSENEENASKYATFLKMIKKVDISDVEKIEKEQEKLAKAIPFKVKFNGNYLWQIYYSEYTDRYFMLVPTEDSDYSTFFYLLKKKIENNKGDMIFVPISYLDYSENILKRSELKDLENYLWFFTKDYPAIYEVYNKKNKETLEIVGETAIYGKIKTLYKMTFANTREANKFYKLLKALFILQVELPHYYNFTTNINDNGEIQLFLDGQQVQYDQLPEFVVNQYKKSIELKQENEENIEDLNKKLKALKKESIKLEKEYLEKEKLISTYLECKKTFFGKVKYFFTTGKKTKKSSKMKKNASNEEESENQEVNQKEIGNIEKRNYTLDELIISFKELEIAENNKKNVVQDINAIKLKNKNLKRKIENAALYINEINKHKKSIFEFWKYSNKDEVAALEEGEEEEVNVSKIERTFNFDDDFEAFGEKVDKNQRLKFADSELDSSYMATTDLFDIINSMYMRKNMELHEFAEILKKLKDGKKEFLEEVNEEFDIFGNESRQNKKERTLGNKIHRETPRDKYQILDIKKGMQETELKKAISDIAKNIKKALKKNSLDEEMYVYKASTNKLDLKGIQVFSLNEQSELNKVFSQNNNDSIIYLYRLKLPKGSNFIAFSNIVLYNNKNMTLPAGMKESNEILIDVESFEITEGTPKELNVKHLRNEKDDFSKAVLEKIEVYEIG